MNIIGKRKWFYIGSTAVLLPGLVALLIWGLRLGIDFTGGSLLELQFDQEVTGDQVEAVVKELGFNEVSVQISGGTVAIIRTRELQLNQQQEQHEDTKAADTTGEVYTSATGDNTDTQISDDQASEPATSDAESTDESTTAEQNSGEIGEAAVNEKQQIIVTLQEKIGTVQEVSFQSIGPVIGKELTRKAIYAVIVASFAIIIYLAWSFRHVPKPASSFRFGICAIAALLHDVFFLLGSFALLGHFFDIEINGMFVVAALTVMGFSVHDSIVVFDRIRETMSKEIGEPFEKIVNDSILETLGRSINTTLTVLFTLLALFLFGGESIRIFSFALLIGTFSGAYSSIFNASPLLVDWQNWVQARQKK